ncbi:HlyD family secretion protein [Vallitalea okinawensis]|uniref:HlyD family secretion protein n=1 Tax=Vallitalea okinawensis TaxID=2078660 RepID=UPI0013008AC6|nr:HlyD family efflux transporter periplasmic adaptor subunit [Vallitalea okinawensis]
MKKKILIIAVIIMVLGGIGFKYYQSKQPLAVNTVQIVKTDYEDYHYEEGSVESKDRIKVFSSANGKIVDLFIGEGDTVNKDDVILSVDQDDLKLELDILYAQKNALEGQEKSEGEVVKDSELKLQKESIEIAENKVSSLQAELEKQKSLFESGAISQNDYEQIEEQYKQAVSELNIQNFRLMTLKESSSLGSGKSQYYEGQMEKIDLQIKQLEEQIQETQILAPVTGTISNFSLVKGDFITKNQLLMEIFDPEQYEVEAYVLAKEVKNLDTGMTAYIEVESQNKTETVKGEITFISSNAVELVSALGLAEKKVKVLVEPKEPINLIQGEIVDVKFITYDKVDAQVISKDYIFPWNDGEGLWIIKEDKAKIVTINKAYDSSSTVILEDEIGEDTVIIIPPYPEQIQEGIEVSTN